MYLHRNIKMFWFALALLWYTNVVNGFDEERRNSNFTSPLLVALMKQQEEDGVHSIALQGLLRALNAGQRPGRQVAVFDARAKAVHDSIYRALHTGDTSVITTQKSDSLNDALSPVARGEMMLIISDRYSGLQRAYRMWKKVLPHMSTNSHGVYVIIWPFDSRIARKYVRNLFNAFRAVFGTTNVILIEVNCMLSCLYTFDYVKGQEIIKKVDADELIRMPSYNKSFSSSLTKVPSIGPDIIIADTFIDAEWWDRNGVRHRDGADIHILRILFEKNIVSNLHKIHSFRKKYISKISGEFAASIILSSDAIFKGTAYKLFSITAPIRQSDFVMILRHPSRMSFGLVLLLPFTGSTWLAVGAVAVAILLAWLVVHRSTDVQSAIVDVLQIFLTGECTRRTPKDSQKLVLFNALFLMVIVASCYSGLLLGFLTVPQYNARIDTIEEAVSSVDRIYISNGMNYQIKKGHPIVHKKTKISDFKKIHSVKRLLQNVVKHRNLSIVLNRRYFEAFRYMYDITNGNPDKLYAVKQPVESGLYDVYYTKKNHPVLEVLDSIILRVWQAGLKEHWIQAQRYRMKIHSLNPTANKTLIWGGQQNITTKVLKGGAGNFLDPKFIKGQALSLEHLKGTFLLLAMCLLIAAIVLMLEFKFPCCRRSNVVEK